MNTEYIAIHNKSLIARGDLITIVELTKAIDLEIEPVVLEFETFKRVEINWRGDARTVVNGLVQLEQVPATKKRGRPKLGVVSKEVTLLPRHWDWLGSQRGGASVSLRRLVDHAIKNASVDETIGIKQNQLYGLLTLLGDEAGFEEATRALYRNSKVNFKGAINEWSEEIQTLLLEKFNAIAKLHEGASDE